MTFNQLLKNIFLLMLCSVTFFCLLCIIRDKTALYTENASAVGIITLRGTIKNSSSPQKQLHSYFNNNYIKAIIMVIDSSAISPATSYALFYEIQALKKEHPKPLIALIENECIGYAYLLASVTDYIIATDGSLIGNIGKIPHKQLTEQDSTTTDDDAAEQLIKQVAMTRKLSLSTTANWAHNHLFTGRQALKLGLINTIGSLHTALQLLRERGFVDHEVVWVKKEKKKHGALSFKISF